ncbi:MAG: hypothetical protein AVDCRST_MAG56-2797 [uncultured Cytophagales bacterium]|uniref:Uncharacterized protein n=1 Tax=uncultured Cytophagales bacterium TaxID=158755 RepID=A0A6J4J122_9SPHI|nr:MAG: hypothetical protein AVDCRST_MAG56-2797 [uncultured Cytophagales bacterium]
MIPISFILQKVSIKKIANNISIRALFHVLFTSIQPFDRQNRRNAPF